MVMSVLGGNGTLPKANIHEPDSPSMERCSHSVDALNIPTWRFETSSFSERPGKGSRMKCARWYLY